MMRGSGVGGIEYPGPSRSTIPKPRACLHCTRGAVIGQRSGTLPLLYLDYTANKSKKTRENNATICNNLMTGIVLVSADYGVYVHDLLSREGRTTVLQLHLTPFPLSSSIIESR